MRAFQRERETHPTTSETKRLNGRERSKRWGQHKDMKGNGRKKLKNDESVPTKHMAVPTSVRIRACECRSDVKNKIF